MSSSKSGSALFNPDWQTGHDGELANAMKRRIDALVAASPGISLAAVARMVGLSPSFMTGLMHGKTIRSARLVVFNTAIERLEQKVIERAQKRLAEQAALTSRSLPAFTGRDERIAVTVPAFTFHVVLIEAGFRESESIENRFYKHYKNPESGIMARVPIRNPDKAILLGKDQPTRTFTKPENLRQSLAIDQRLVGTFEYATVHEVLHEFHRGGSWRAIREADIAPDVLASKIWLATINRMSDRPGTSVGVFRTKDSALVWLEQVAATYSANGHRAEEVKALEQKSATTIGGDIFELQQTTISELLRVPSDVVLAYFAPNEVDDGTKDDRDD